MKKWIPNLITILRIVGTAGLLLMDSFTVPFYVLYALCGFSDLLDGFLARRWHVTSELGARLDSLADLTYYTVVVCRIFPELLAGLTVPLWCAGISVVVLRVGCYLFAAVKFRRFAALHTLLNKLTSAMIFFVVYVVKTRMLVGYCWAMFVVSLTAVVEEYIIHARSKEYTGSVLSVFCLKKGEGC